MFHLHFKNIINILYWFTAHNLNKSIIFILDMSQSTMKSKVKYSWDKLMQILTQNRIFNMFLNFLKYVIEKKDIELYN